ncbi:ESX secretion-associated protein EspG [Actinokineospora auranticolor]|uniref:ESAT-6 protein secretion system EspG family protein n=1 Tax=Actinokineospora auranticolor TaxID=155976 RepID=A0A2S6GRK7_9PSEU|nr:ESX secretion-associated protein EspG [Actinokineospora auranticolor]PPK67829.1 ESAT-6 protein secretion system EspG family protein [Actinokineospora auranticolor]
MTAPHRLTLTAAEYAYLVGELGLSMPPDWAPAPDIADAGDLIAKGVLRGSDDAEIHPSVAANLRVVAAPQIMLDTTATAGSRGSRSVHVVAGQVGASLFLLPDAGVELSMFAAVDLGRELVRAVPAEEAPGIGAALDGDEPREPLTGVVPLAALHELGVAELLRDTDPDAPGYVLAELKLPKAEAEFALEVVRRTDGVLRCLVTAKVGESVRSAQVDWLHSDAGWVGMQPAAHGAGRRLVELAPVDREDLGIWVTPCVAEALA